MAFEANNKALEKLEEFIEEYKKHASNRDIYDGIGNLAISVLAQTLSNYMHNVQNDTEGNETNDAVITCSMAKALNKSMGSILGVMTRITASITSDEEE